MWVDLVCTGSNSGNQCFLWNHPFGKKLEKYLILWKFNFHIFFQQSLINLGSQFTKTHYSYQVYIKVNSCVDFYPWVRMSYLPRMSAVNKMTVIKSEWMDKNHIQTNTSIVTSDYFSAKCILHREHIQVIKWKHL